MIGRHLCLLTALDQSLVQEVGEEQGAVTSLTRDQALRTTFSGGLVGGRGGDGEVVLWGQGGGEWCFLLHRNYMWKVSQWDLRIRSADLRN